MFNNVLPARTNLEKMLICTAVLFACFFNTAFIAEANYYQGTYYYQATYAVKPTCTLTAKPASLTNYLGKISTSTLTWTTTGATKVVLTRPNKSTVNRVLNGSNVINQSGTYQITATGLGGVVNCTKTVGMIIVEPKPVLCTLTATPKVITAGQSSKLAWTTTNATYVTLTKTGGGSVVQPKSGATSVFPISSYTYKLEAANIPVGSFDGNYPRTTCLATVTVSTSTPIYTQGMYYSQGTYTSGTVLGISTDVLAEIMSKLQSISAEIKKLQQ